MNVDRLVQINAFLHDAIADLVSLVLDYAFELRRLLPREH